MKRKSEEGERKENKYTGEILVEPLIRFVCSKLHKVLPNACVFFVLPLVIRLVLFRSQCFFFSFNIKSL